MYVLALIQSAGAQASPGLNDWQQKILIAFFSALLAFGGAYILDSRKRRREPKKQLSYDLSVTDPLVDVEQQVKGKVTVLYADVPTNNIFYAACNVENTGNQLVKDELIAFEFAEGTQVLDLKLDPTPRPELRVKRLEAVETATPEAQFAMGLLAPGQQIGFRFVLSHTTKPSVRIHPHNENDAVEFIPRAVSKERDERQSLNRFIWLWMLLWVMGGVQSAINGMHDQLLTELAGTLFLVLRVVVLVLILPLLKPVVRIAGEILNAIRTTRANPQLTINTRAFQDSIVMMESHNSAPTVVAASKRPDAALGDHAEGETKLLESQLS